MTSAIERHATLIEHGWTTRLDGLWRPPTDWHDRRAYTLAAAWDAHLGGQGRADRKGFLSERYRSLHERLVVPDR